MGRGWAWPNRDWPEVGVACGPALWESGNGIVDDVRRDAGVGHV